MKATLALCLLTLVSGALIPIQAAANAALSRSFGGNIPFAALSLFLVATLVTGAGILITGGKPPEMAALRGAPWWGFAGGFIVTFYIFTITFVAPRLGVGTAIALIVTGQIIAALTIDHFGLLRSMVFPITGARIFGAILMGVGAFIAMRR